MTPELEAQLLRDVGHLVGSMRDSVRLREEDAAVRRERQHQLDKRFSAIEKKVDTVEERVAEWAIVVRLLKWVGAGLVFVFTVKVGDIPELIRTWLGR